VRNLAGVNCCKFGVDVCDDFLKISSQYETMIKAEQTDLLFNGCFDYFLLVVVFHHLLMEEERVRCVEEMMRLLKNGGLFLEVFEIWENGMFF